MAKRLGFICLGLAIPLFLYFASHLMAESPSELRGVWLTNVDSDVLFSRSNLERAVQRLRNLNFNTIYPTVWHEGYTLYPSQVAANSFGHSIRPEPEYQGRDLLAETIELGHRQGLRVIPWFEFGLMTDENAALTRKYPQWLTNRQDGSSLFIFGDRGQHRYLWLNPLRPEVQQLLVDLIVEVVTKYDVDGIQLDDHFGLPAELGYDPYTIAIYQRDHNGKLPPNDPKDREWLRWRAQFITQLMTKITRGVRAVKPKCLISLSPNPKTFAYENYLQDWQRWVDTGLLDEVVIQVYRSDMASFTRELNQPELKAVRQTTPVSIGILTGLRTRAVTMATIKEQVRATRNLGFQGFSFFFYESLGDRDQDFQNLINE